MIKHVYLMRLKDKSLVPEVLDALHVMKENIPSIHRLEVGADITGAAASYDLIQICEFCTQADFADFTNHPYHQVVRDYLKTVQVAAVKVDYITENEE